ncbi:hypothetical protein ACQ4PT_042766 [Festuca glaucescens]
MDGAAMERFEAAAGLASRGLSYAVVSIFGPQGSGKSTLLNRLFGTSFTEMDALKGRNQTTKGMWVAKAVVIEPFTVVMDLEGTDGRERGETPVEYLAQALTEDIQKIWDSVHKPEVFKEASLSDFFNVDVTALSSYEEKEELFKEQVGELRHRFINSIAPSGLAADRRGVIPASAFCISAMQIWKVIQENKDLNLPAHKVMVATVRCEEIADERLRCFMSDEGWLELEAAAKSGPVTGFGTKLSAIVDFYLSE